MGARSNLDSLGVASVDYPMYAGYVTMAQHWLYEEAASQTRLGRPGPPHRVLRGQGPDSRFFFEHVLPRTSSLTETMFTPVDTVGHERGSLFFDHARTKATGSIHMRVRAWSEG